MKLDINDDIPTLPCFGVLSECYVTCRPGEPAWLRALATINRLFVCLFVCLFVAV